MPYTIVKFTNFFCNLYFPHSSSPLAKNKHAHVLSCFSRVWLFVTPWSVALQAPLYKRFFRQEYWSGMPYSPSGDLRNPRIESASLMSPALAGRLFTTSAKHSYQSWLLWSNITFFSQPHSNISLKMYYTCLTFPNGLYSSHEDRAYPSTLSLYLHITQYIALQVESLTERKYKQESNGIEEHNKRILKYNRRHQQ